MVRPIGQDPEELRALNPDLNIWDAYATIHLLMPDGSMKLGGEAVAEVLRNLPSTRWFSWTFGINVFGTRPFQAMLNVAYAILADVRPVFGCESCGTPSPLGASDQMGRQMDSFAIWHESSSATQVPISPRCRAGKYPASTSDLSSVLQ